MDINLDSRARKIELCWYLLAFLIAASLRFIKLGSLPFGNGEADLALQALALSKGAEGIISGQPGYVSITSFFFSIFSANEFWALFFPALFGSAIVFIPNLFKNWLGKNCAILLAFFLAIDPGMVAVSRIASGSMITIVSLLAAIGFVLHKRSLWAGVFAGLFLLGGTASWPGVIVILILILVMNLTPSTKRNLEDFFSGLNKKLFFFSLGTVVLTIGTGFLFHPRIISGMGSGFYDFFHSFFETSGVPLKVMLIALPISELLVLPLAIWGMVVGNKKRETLSLLLGISVLLFAFMAMINSSRQVTDWVWTLIPLILLASKGADDLLARFTGHELEITIIQAALTIVLITFSFLNLLAFVAYPPVDATTLRNGILEVVLPIAFLIVVTILLAWGWSMRASQQGLVIGFGLLLLFISIGSAWKSAGLGPRPETELWRQDPLPIGSNLLQGTASQLSLFSTGQENRLDIVLLDQDSPSLRWGLRDFEKLELVKYLGTTETPSIILSGTDSQIGSTAIYRGQEIRWTARADYDNMNASGWLKWFAYRQVPMKTENILLWARNDLFKY